MYKMKGKRRKIAKRTMKRKWSARRKISRRKIGHNW